MEAAARGMSSRHQLSTSSSVDDAAVAETVEVARGQEKEHVARQRKERHDVLGLHGHQDGLRRGKTKAYRKTHG